MAKTKFEALIEHIVNDEHESARELFHDIVVEKSREIYNELVAEDEEIPSGDESSDLESDIENVDADEEGFDAEDIEDAADELEDEMSDDEDNMDSEPDEIEDRVVDLEAGMDDLDLAIEKLKAEFDELMSQEETEPEHSDLGMDSEEYSDSEDMNPMSPMMPKEGIVREYTEKVGDAFKGSKTEGHTVGTGSSDKPSVNTRSTVAGKNDMGGTAKNLAQGGSNAAPDGTSAPKHPKVGEIELGKRNVNQVGGNKGAEDFYKTKAKAPSKETAGVNDKSPLAKS